MEVRRRSIYAMPFLLPGFLIRLFCHHALSTHCVGVALYSHGYCYRPRGKLYLEDPDLPTDVLPYLPNLAFRVPPIYLRSTARESVAHTLDFHIPYSTFVRFVDSWVLRP